MQEYAELAGIEGHDSTTIFYGGFKGSAAAIWNNESAPDSQAIVKGHLDGGDIEMLGMTIFVDEEAPEGDVRRIDSQIQGLKNWVEYARSKNPDTSLWRCRGQGDPWTMLGRLATRRPVVMRPTGRESSSRKRNHAAHRRVKRHL